MKMLVFSFIVGLFILYFLNIALLRAPILDLEWSIHASIRFFAGFIILGISCFYGHAIKFQNALYIVACIVIADYIYDYYNLDYNLKFEIILHGIFMILWGAVSGYLTAKYLKEKSTLG